MSSRSALSFGLIAALTSLVACGGSTAQSEQGDDQNVASATDLLYVAAGQGPTGGTQVREVNVTTTRCADGKKAGSCTVVAVSFAALKLSGPQNSALEKAFGAGQAIVKGKLTTETTKDPASITIPKLTVSEAWVAQSGHALADGESVFLVNNKILNGFCTAACGALRQTTVNTSQAQDIGQVDFGTVKVAAARLDDIKQDMLIGGPGALIAGVDHQLGGKGPEAPNLFASEIYLHAGALTGEACSSDVAIQASCAPGLECVFPQGAPISEHQAGTCNRLK